MSTLNPEILAVPGDVMACGVYRIINPSILLQQANVNITLAPACKFKVNNYDVIYTQRITSEGSLKAMKTIKDRTGVKMIVDFDDLTWNHEGQGLPDYNYCNTKVDCEANRIAMETYANDVIDVATCTTEALKEALSKFIDPKRIKIVPNRLMVNEWLYETTKTIPADDVFLYAGSATHYAPDGSSYGDFSNGWVKYLQNKKLITMSNTPPFLKTLKQFPAVPMSVYSKSFYNTSRVCKFIIAPLADNFFNKCKSDLKLLEAAAVGRVCLVTDFPGSPYANAHPLQKVPVNATYKTIEYIVEEAKKHYKEILDFQYEYLHKRWLNNAIDEYKEILK